MTTEFTDRLTVVGTSHISPKSIATVKKAIEDNEPQIVAVELDQKRLIALTTKNPKRPSALAIIRRVGMIGYIFSLAGNWVEHKLGDKLGTKPGSEMLTAVQRASETGARVALIDQDIEVTLRRLSKGITFKEKLNGCVDVVKGVFGKGVMTFDIASVPSSQLIEKLLSQVKDRYPNFYRVLVKERNEFLAKRLASLLKAFPDDKIVAVIGAGHKTEVRRLVKKYLSKSH
jgi:pheromone shutdown-related protein TraB